ncbi:hypothetical protein FBU30_008124 [Linnemannia zychae]|nr:hypothetical protein FBU30_008124 [Linnemannia zychae]
MDNNNISSVSSLPFEIIDLIASYLTHRDLYSCVLVDKDFFQLFARHLWKNLQCHYLNQSYEYYVQWHLQLQRSIQAGGLRRNGQWIRTFKCRFYNAVELFACQGQLCNGLRELVLESSLYSPLLDLTPSDLSSTFDLSPLLIILERNTQIQHLRFTGRMLNEQHSDFSRLLKAIPSSVENLELHGWDPLRKGRAPVWQLQHEEQDDETPKDNGFKSDLDNPLDYAAASLFPNLRRLALHSYAVDVNKHALTHIITNSPNLETIHLEDAITPIPLKLLTDLLHKLCPRLVHLHLLNWDSCLDSDLARLLNVSKAGWRTIGIPQVLFNGPYDFGPSPRAVFLRHAPTLENVRFEGSMSYLSPTIVQLFCTAPNLKRFDAISQDRTVEGGMFSINAMDIINGSDWVCTKLESLKVQIEGITRPDIPTRTNGRPFLNDLHTGNSTSRLIQRRIYAQLGRLVNLKQLVLGHDGIDWDTPGVYEREEWSEGEYLAIGNSDIIQNGYQYECLEMSLESGMGHLSGLKELRKIELRAMAVATWKGKEEEMWVRENWPKLDPNYQDLFWQNLGYQEYY